MGFNWIIFRAYWPKSKHEDAIETIKLIGEKILPYFKEKS